MTLPIISAKWRQHEWIFTSKYVRRKIQNLETSRLLLIEIIDKNDHLIIQTFN